jgi:hypothetical protein
MKPRQQLYELVKQEMKQRGHWKAKPRGQQYKTGYNPYKQALKQGGQTRMNMMTKEERSTFGREAAQAKARKKREV